MTKLTLTAALGDYDHTRDLASGRVDAEGIDLRVLNFNVEQIFYRFHKYREWDVSEYSMGLYVSGASQPDHRCIAIPIFPSRVFRHSAIYIRDGGTVSRPEDLYGKRIGCPQWSQTAAVYVRGYLAETVGLPLSSIRWVQAGVNQPGRPEPATLKLPDDIDLSFLPTETLDDLLLKGEIDAIISARPPKSFGTGTGVIRRLFPDYRGAEEDYFRQTSIFPIMHTVAIRRDVYESNRWIARNLFIAFEAAKRRCVERLSDITASHAPVPWGSLALETNGAATAFADSDYWPYGVEPNRKTLEAFLRFSHDQGICHRPLDLDELFAPEALFSTQI